MNVRYISFTQKTKDYITELLYNKYRVNPLEDYVEIKDIPKDFLDEPIIRLRINILTKWVGTVDIPEHVKKILDIIIDNKINIDSSSLINPITSKDEDCNAPYIYYDSYIYYRHLQKSKEKMMRLSSSVPLAITSVEYNETAQCIIRTRWLYKNNTVYIKTGTTETMCLEKLTEAVTVRYGNTTSTPSSFDYNRYIKCLNGAIKENLLTNSPNNTEILVGNIIYDYYKNANNKNDI